MTNSAAVAELFSLQASGDPYLHSPQDLLDLQLRAVDDLLAERRTQIKLLQQRADAEGIDTIRRLSEVVPLLFSHTNYKSYPDAFIARGRWDMMNRWLDTMSTNRVTGVDLTGVIDTDGWVTRLVEFGHHVEASSGTQGKCSFLNQSDIDIKRERTIHPRTFMWAAHLESSGRSRPLFALVPSGGPFRFIQARIALAEAIGRPGATYFLSDEPLTVAATNSLGTLNRAMAHGTATPNDIRKAQEVSIQRRAKAEDDMLRIVRHLRDHLDEPIVVTGHDARVFELVVTARTQGIADGSVHRDSVVITGGGSKGRALPLDVQEQVRLFFGLDDEHFCRTYGMSELSIPFPQCSARRFHVPPLVLPLLLDRAGERVLNPVSGGDAIGRMAGFSFMVEGRWGGVISGDRVHAHFDPCPCGLHSMSISEIVRYNDIPGDDKLTCAGTIDAYVRGLISDT